MQDRNKTRAAANTEAEVSAGLSEKAMQQVCCFILLCTLQHPSNLVTATAHTRQRPLHGYINWLCICRMVRADGCAVINVHIQPFAAFANVHHAMTRLQSL